MQKNSQAALHGWYVYRFHRLRAQRITKKQRFCSEIAGAVRIGLDAALFGDNIIFDTA